MENNQQNWTAVISLVVSIAAISISVYAAYDNHRNYKRAVEPLLTFTNNLDGLGPEVGVSVENAGAGPAIFHTMTIYVDRKPVRKWEEVFEYGDLGDKKEIRRLNYDNDVILHSGGSLLLFGRQTTKNTGLDQFIDFVDHHLGVYIVYCSIDDECQAACSVDGRCG